MTAATRRDCKRHGPHGDGDDACTCYPTLYEQFAESKERLRRYERVIEELGFSEQFRIAYVAAFGVGT